MTTQEKPQLTPWTVTYRATADDPAVSQTTVRASDAASAAAYVQRTTFRCHEVTNVQRSKS